MACAGCDGHAIGSEARALFGHLDRTAVLFAASPIIAPGSLSNAAIFSMLPFAAILAIVAVGQTMVVQQRGLDLSVPGAISLAAVLAPSSPTRRTTWCPGRSPSPSLPAPESA